MRLFNMAKKKKKEEEVKKPKDKEVKSQVDQPDEDERDFGGFPSDVPFKRNMGCGG